MRVWRVAHRTAVYKDFPAGPYAGAKALPADDAEIVWGLCIDHIGNPHPSPGADPELGHYIAGHEVCGFNSPDALYEWFDRWTGRLSEAGYIVYEYDSDDARVGRYGQTVFDRRTAKLVRSYPLDTKPAQLALF